MPSPIPYGRQYIDEDDINAVIEVLRGDYLTTGPYVNEFEERFAAYVGARYAVAVSSGTSALHLACLAGDINKGSEVITSTMSFAASANCAVYVGAKPVLADIDKNTYNISPDEIEKRISNKTRAIIPVHYSGLPCFMDEIQEIARKNNLLVIEDACHALGARYEDSLIGDCKYSDMAVFSFHPVKHITTGEGGMITTNSKLIYDRLIMLRSHGITRDPESFSEDSHGDWYYEMQMLGYNYRLTDIQSALGISQLKKIDQFVSRRREIANMYNEALKDLPVDLPVEPVDCTSSFHLYLIKTNKDTRIDRAGLYSRLKNKGINCQVHYMPIHTLPFYRRELGYDWGDYPTAEDHYKRVLSIPIFPAMEDWDVEMVVSGLIEAMI